jgi:hypothetical protein
MNALDRIAEMNPHQQMMLIDELERNRRPHAVPNIYRVKDDTRWQCEWDDLTEAGAFRSRSLGRAVRKANRARRRYLLAALLKMEVA